MGVFRRVFRVQPHPKGVHPPKLLMPIAYSPLFPQIFYIFTLFPQNYEFTPISAKLPVFLNLRFFASPYFDLDAFMHHVLHVLDAPESPMKWICSCCKSLKLRPKSMETPKIIITRNIFCLCPCYLCNIFPLNKKVCFYCWQIGPRLHLNNTLLWDCP